MKVGQMVFLASLMPKKKEISREEIKPECCFNGNCNERESAIGIMTRDLFLPITKTPKK